MASAANARAQSSIDRTNKAPGCGGLFLFSPSAKPVTRCRLIPKTHSIPTIRAHCRASSSVPNRPPTHRPRMGSMIGSCPGRPTTVPMIGSCRCRLQQRRASDSPHPARSPCPPIPAIHHPRGRIRSRPSGRSSRRAAPARWPGIRRSSSEIRRPSRPPHQPHRRGPRGRRPKSRTFGHLAAFSTVWLSWGLGGVPTREARSRWVVPSTVRLSRRSASPGSRKLAPVWWPAGHFRPAGIIGRRFRECVPASATAAICRPATCRADRTQTDHGLFARRDRR